MDGANNQQGRVEVCQNRRWAAVCDSLWGVNDAQVVCRQLGFSTTGKIDEPCIDNTCMYLHTGTVALKQSAFGSGLLPKRLTNVGCAGTESSLLSCPYNVNTASSSVASVSCGSGSE